MVGGEGVARGVNILRDMQALDDTTRTRTALGLTFVVAVCGIVRVPRLIA